MTHDARRHDIPRRRWHMAWLLLALGLLVPLAATPSHAVAPRSTATVAGTVVLAGTGGALAQVRVCVVGTSTCATTAANGQYTLGGVAAGSRTLRLTRTGHATLDVPLTLRPRQRATPRSAMVPKPVGNELRIVLSWGAAPADLDSYLWVPQGGGAYRVEPGQRGSVAGSPFAVLVREDNDGQGPEHTYVSRVQAGRSTFAVFNDSAHARPGSAALAGSGAVVEVYDRNGLRGRFVAPARGTGKWWTVFHYVGPSGALTAVNTLGNVPPTAMATSTPTAMATSTPTATATSTPTATATSTARAAVMGTIMDSSTRAALNQTQVCVVGSDRCTTSDAFGRYTLSDVPAGARTLRVMRSGYNTHDSAVMLFGGHTVPRDVLLTRLLPPQPPATETATSTPTPTATATSTPTATATSTPTATALPTDRAGAVYLTIPAFQRIPPFRIMRTEVTNAQYRACVTAGACTLPSSTTHYDDPARAEHPVVWVTRTQARAYAAWVGGTLPTEAQWLRACQGDGGRTYPWGNQSPDATRANYNNNVGGTTAVGSYPAGASPYGALDMAGNVWEWADDGNFTIRGGAFNAAASYMVCGAQVRGVDNYDIVGYSHVGFRVVVVLPAYASIPAGNGVPAFRIGYTEVTNAQYRACVTAGACTLPSNTTRYGEPTRAEHPVVYVTRAQARAYAAWVGGALPTEAQWLRACQGDDGRRYPWGEAAPDETRANYRNNVGDTTAVGSYPAGASPYGALDMAGNVSEWADDGNVVIRGGAFDYINAVSVACRAWGEGGVDFDSYYVGFRVVFPGP